MSSNTADPLSASVIAVCRRPDHGFSKAPEASIRLLAGLGVEGDAHCGATVQHLYLKRKDPYAPNRLQVHLLQSELFDDLAAAGFQLRAGELGENITTIGIDLLTLPLDTRLHLGKAAVVQLTGLRTPCRKIDSLRPGLMEQMKQAPGLPARAGVMAIVLQGGEVRPADRLQVELPAVRVPLRLV